MRKNKGHLFIISAPSGTGKSTICWRLKEKFINLEESVSYTTRSPRKGEVDHVDYSFIETDEFKSMIKRNEFLEWAEVHGNYYGTSAKRIKSLLDKGKDVLLDIDTQGAGQIRERIEKEGGMFPNTSFIFILPPSIKELSERLNKRGTDSGETIKRRLDKAKDEIKDYIFYDYVIMNDNLKNAVSELETIILAAGMRRENLDEHWIKEAFLTVEC